ncbi:hypothetical protein K0T92_19265 [Paenibacillus oenotherae]|uniref:5-bromo-4-chloroindolyl phosphate hydrolysis protein n=1 Tax=Paenibacillus oenotherae TaxID=1435645 RepID=A0ABS7DAF0_9BACL|nr:hypothetical protein [Paenibacillus oenotherae]MBW7476860.1 hypothetical protein [Paenibacillus oenotherae]
MQFRTRSVFLYGLIGYLVGLVTYNILPPFITMAIPMIALVAGALRSKRKDRELPPSSQPLTILPPGVPAPSAVPAPTAGSPSAALNLGAHSRSPKQPAQQAESAAPPMDEGMREMVEYIALIEEMIISEGQKNNLDDEIVEKSLSLLARIHRVIPQLVELGNADINHNMKRLVLRDLNGFVTPFLKLRGDMKRQNRRILLDGLKDINSKINAYVETLEQKDLVELQTKADIIHQRYSTRQF